MLGENRIFDSIYYILKCLSVLFVQKDCKVTDQFLSLFVFFVLMISFVSKGETATPVDSTDGDTRIRKYLSNDSFRFLIDSYIFFEIVDARRLNEHLSVAHLNVQNFQLLYFFLQSIKLFSNTFLATRQAVLMKVIIKRRIHILFVHTH